MAARDIADAPSLMDLSIDRDAIAVRDYLREIEIGAFQQERGVVQRVRFNVVLDTDPTHAADDDDVDKVLSYDTIVEAIEDELAAERVNLLETLAERVATRCLTDNRVRRVHVRIEKLDRIPGALGVEIIRHATQSRSAPSMHGAGRVGQDGKILPHVYLLTNAALASGQMPDWLNAITNEPAPAIIALEPVQDGLPAGSDQTRSMIHLRIGLLSIEQNAWLLAEQDDRCVVVSSRTELDHAAKNGRMSVWAPSKMVLDATQRPKASASDPVGLALWFAEEIGADGLTLVGTTADKRQSDVPLRALDANDPGALGR